MSPPTSSSVRRTAGNAVALVAAYVVGRGLAFVAVVVAARVVGAESFGMYGTAAALAVIVSLVSTLGMLPLLVREMARSPDEAPRWLAAADRVKHGSNLVMLAVLWGVAGPVLGLEPAAVTAALLLGGGYALESYVENRLAWSRAVERMSTVTWATTIYGVVTGALGVTAIAATGSVVVFCAAPLLGQSAVLVYLRVRLPASLRAGRARTEDVASLVRAVAPFATGFVMLTLFYKTDVVLLERWRARAEVGLYVVAYRFVDIAHALALAGVGAVYPALARASAGERGRRIPPGRRVGELALLAWAPVAGALLLAREAVLVGLFGGGYAAAVPLLAVLAPAIGALAFNLHSTYLLGASGHMRWMALLYGGALGVKVGLDVWLIPGRGPGGAALAALLAELILAVGFVGVLARVLGSAPRPRIWGILAGTAGLAAAASLLPTPLGRVVPAAAFLVGTGALYGVARVVAPTEWRAVRDALGRDRTADPVGAGGAS